MAWDSPTTINASQGFESLIPYLDGVTQHWFGRMFLFAVFLIFIFGYMRSKAGSFWDALAVSSYVTFIIGLLFWVIGIITGIDFSIVIGITLISTLILLLQNRD